MSAISAKALQNVLVDVFNAAGEGQEIDLYDAICVEMCRDYDDAGDAGDGGDNPNFDGPALEAATYRDAGVLTTDAGLVVRVGAREFQVTITRSR
jgi:hypothetical protein